MNKRVERICDIMTLRELAILANVSKATASRAFSNSTEISEETRQHVFRVAREYNCYDKFQKGLYFKKVIAVISPDIRSDYYNNIVDHLDTLIASSGGNMVLSLSYYDPAKEEAIYSYHAHYQKVDGIIIINSCSPQKHDCSIPTVYIDSPSRTRDAINTNWQTGIDAAIEHLWKNGHKKIAYVGDNLSSAKQRCFCNAMKKYALPISEEYTVIEQHRYETGGYRAMEKILTLNEKPTALFVAYDYMAIGVYKCIREEALSVPNDFSIIGMENINTKDYLDTPLSSIYGRSREKCESAIELLLKKMDNKRYSEPTKILESTLISRTSVKNLKKV